MGFRNSIRAALIAAALTAGAARAQVRADASAARLEELVGREGGLRSDEVAARAVATSPELRRSREEVAAASAELRRALIAYAPRFSLSAQYTRLSSIGTQSLGTINLTSPLDQFTFQQGVSVPLLDYALRLPRAHRAAEMERASAITNDRAGRLKSAADARLSYYGWVRARLERAVAEQALLQARQHRQMVGHLFQVGSASRADVMRLEAQVASSELFLQRARSLEIVREDQLRTLMHDGSGRPYEIGEDLRPQPPQPPADVEELVASAWSARPELRATAQSADAARARAGAVRALALPKVTGFFTLTTAQPNERYLPPRESFDRTWAAGVQISLSPNDVFDSWAAARSAEAKAAQLDAGRESLRDAVRSEVEQAVESLRQAGQAQESAARGLQAAEESHRVRRALFAEGRATSVELTDAETELTQARLDDIGARVDQRVARVQLDHAIGRDTN